MPFRLVRLIIIALKFIFFPKLVHLFQVTLHNCISKFNINVKYLMELKFRKSNSNYLVIFLITDIFHNHIRKHEKF